jgi:small subunit ribosomal protein S1
VLLPYGLEAFAPIRHVKKEDGNLAEVDETLPFKVIEFNRDDKRILVSHTRFFSDVKKEGDDKEKSDKKKHEKDAKDDLKKAQGKVERSTLGDLDVFSELKEQMKEDENQDK